MRDLVIDVGMNNGEDTAYYLSLGFRVVAVEADPQLCKAGELRFQDALSDGRLSIRNVGITETAGESTFWVSSHSDWSSFHEENAIKGGATAEPIVVPTLPFRALLEELDAPYFVKIDIEMNDRLCLEDMASSEKRPPYLSFEGNEHSDRDVELLSDSGYHKFKCVRQNDWREMTPRSVILQGQARRVLAKLPSGTDRLGRYGDRIARLHYRPRSVNGYQFKPGSSGPMAKDLPGPWLDHDEVMSVWHHVTGFDYGLSAHGIGEWFDIHAALEETS